MGVLVGVDWGGGAHAVCVIDAKGLVLERFGIDHDRAGLALLLTRLKTHGAPGTIPVAIVGGAREVIVFRPEGVMVRVATQGDVARVIIDSGRPIGPLTGNTTVEPPGYALSEDRYDISVGGACESVLVTTVPAA